MTEKIDRLIVEFLALTDEEKREFLNRLNDTIEMLGWLKVSEPAFNAWDNVEDTVYNDGV